MTNRLPSAPEGFPGSAEDEMRIARNRRRAEKRRAVTFLATPGESWAVRYKGRYDERVARYARRTRGGL